MRHFLRFSNTVVFFLSSGTFLDTKRLYFTVNLVFKIRCCSSRSLMLSDNLSNGKHQGIWQRSFLDNFSNVCLPRRVLGPLTTRENTCDYSCNVRQNSKVINSVNFVQVSQECFSRFIVARKWFRKLRIFYLAQSTEMQSHNLPLLNSPNFRLDI